MRAKLVRVFAAGALTVLVVVGCDKTAPHPDTPAGRPKATGQKTSPLKPGDLLPAIEPEGWINGPPPAPGSAGVCLHVVDAWAHWCPYCARTAPAITRAYQKYAGRGVAFVAVTTHEREDVETYAKKFGITWPSGYGAGPGLVHSLGAGSGMTGPADYEIAPTLYLVGPDGRVRWVDGQGRLRHVDPEKWEKALDEAIEANLAVPPAKGP